VKGKNKAWQFKLKNAKLVGIFVTREISQKSARSIADCCGDHVEGWERQVPIVQKGRWEEGCHVRKGTSPSPVGVSDWRLDSKEDSIGDCSTS
jgi:hypothetical protein